MAAIATRGDNPTGEFRFTAGFVSFLRRRVIRRRGGGFVIAIGFPAQGGSSGFPGRWLLVVGTVRSGRLSRFLTSPRLPCPLCWSPFALPDDVRPRDGCCSPLPPGSQPSCARFDPEKSLPVTCACLPGAGSDLPLPPGESLVTAMVASPPLASLPPCHPPRGPYVFALPGVSCKGAWHAW